MDSKSFQTEENLLANLCGGIESVYVDAEDHSETRLILAMGKASEIGQHDLAYEVFEATIEFVLQELMLGDIGGETLEAIAAFRQKQRQDPAK